MALVQCPDCGQAVSDTADACPRCGRNMNVIVIEGTEAEWTATWVLLGLGVLVILYLLANY